MASHDEEPGENDASGLQRLQVSGDLPAGRQVDGQTDERCARAHLDDPSIERVLRPDAELAEQRVPDTDHLLHAIHELLLATHEDERLAP
ncbi:MAG: hypothetical protein ACR2KK_19350 [Acidimicrobiales bacterium]